MNTIVDSELYEEVAAFGARDMEVCMQCATCSASCPLSSGSHSFPRKIYRYLQLGLRDKLLRSAEPWLCYYCGECNVDCPRGAEPAETMMAVRRWLTTQYDWTGLARRFYLSTAWELGALTAVGLGVVALFALFHGPVITDRMAVNTFAPVVWVETGDLVMAAVLSAFLLSNAFRMFRFVMDGARVPPAFYVREARSFVLHFLTQKRWRECGPDRRRWMKHFTLVTGYLTMMTLVIVFIRWFQVDDSSWHFTSLFGYYATGVLLAMTVEMFRSRLKKEETIHRYSELSDWLFLILLFCTTLTGILMHLLRLSGWPLGTYAMYVVHLAVAVPMLVIEVPFGKWSHLFYRPLALYLSRVKERAAEASRISAETLGEIVGETYQTCLQCGSCTGACPLNRVSAYSPRHILRGLALGNGTADSVDRAAWGCLTCNACAAACPPGIDIAGTLRAVRRLGVEGGRLPDDFAGPLESLEAAGNPWGEKAEKRGEWARGLTLPAFTPEREYCLFTCCTTAYDSDNRPAGRALVRLLGRADVSFGVLGPLEACCGDPAHGAGADDRARALERSNRQRLEASGVTRLLVTSPHCLDAFRKRYDGLAETVRVDHYSEVLDRSISEGRLVPLGRLDLRVAYHDPCYLGRHNGIYDAPRRVLRAIPGVVPVELPENREAGLCCGGGGGGAFTEAATRDLGGMRVQDALDAGADVLATACPFCLRTLRRAARELGLDRRIVVEDLASLLWQSVGMTLPAEAGPGIQTEVAGEVCHV